MLPCVFWRLSFCLKWKFRVFEGLQWIGRPVGSQAVICTPVIWSMVIIAVCVCVCVCVCVFYYEVAIQTNTQCGQSKKKRLFLWPHLLLLLMKYPQNLIFLFFTLSFLPSHWVTSPLSLFFSLPSLLPSPPLSSLPPFIHTFRRSVPSSLPLGQKNLAVTLHRSWEAVILGLCPTSD